MPSYVHRVGRTARAGKSGRAVSLVGDSDRKIFKVILKASHGQVIQRVVKADSINKIKLKIASFEPDVQAVEEAEKEERQLRLAEMEVRKMENIIKYQEEIAARPKRDWFMTGWEKKTNRENANEIELGGDAEGGGRSSTPHYDRLTKAQKERVDEATNTGKPRRGGDRDEDSGVNRKKRKRDDKPSKSQKKRKVSEEDKKCAFSWVLNGKLD